MPQTKLITAKLTRRYYDKRRVLHPVGTILTLPAGEMPRSARVLGKEAAASFEKDQEREKELAQAEEKVVSLKKPPKQKAPDTLRDLTDAEAPDIDATNVKKGDTLKSLSKKAKD